MRARYIHEVGTRGQLRIYWDRETITEVHPADKDGWVGTTGKSHLECPNTYGTGRPGCHNAYTFLRDDPNPEQWETFGKREDYPAERWPTHCKSCGAPVPEETPREKRVGWSGYVVHRQVFTSRLYNTASGEPEIGDMFESHWHDAYECPYWDNCNGIHLQVILPDGHHWDAHSRASNCTKKDERTHRCWVLHGSYKDGTITADKNGFTCEAGAGSIASANWHGFLRDGQLVT
jgi:hypothetical protein